MEIDSVASAHAGFNLSNSGVGVSVKELEVADAIARKEGTSHGAVKSLWGLGYYKHWAAHLRENVLPHVT